MASQITGIPVDRIIKLAREIGQQNPLISARAGDRNARQTATDCTRYCDVAYSDGQCRHQRGNSGARESTYTITIERLPVLIIRSKRQSPASAGRMLSIMAANDGNPRRRPGQR